MYKKNQFNSIVRLIDGASIPADDRNIDYQAYLAWLAEGNTPEPAGTEEERLEWSVAAAWERIRTERGRRMAGGVMVSVAGTNKWFHSDPSSRIQHLGLKDKARDLLASGGGMGDAVIILGHPVAWKTLDGSFVEITVQVAFDIITAAGNLDAQLFAVAESHKTSLAENPDPGSYDFSGGWPASFGQLLGSQQRELEGLK